ncbi:hypothetical protein AB0E01_42465 [Nocardia vinacea]|uniref:hypothetical protein n=1 Tax=Nocardia vinacea TaxID=96468 RepID=UPI00340455F1
MPDPCIGQCPECLGWGMLHGRFCSACGTWRVRYPATATCARCHHDSHLNPETLCRGCLLALRAEADADWFVDPQIARPRQLTLILAGIGTPKRFGVAQRLRKPSLRKAIQPRGRAEWRRRSGPEREHDDPRICPPTSPGQLMLLFPRRKLRLRMARRILRRGLDGYEQARPFVHAYANAHRYSKPWVHQCELMIRLALAVRDADGRTLVATESLDDLQHYSSHIRVILQRAGLLDLTATARTATACAPARRPTPSGRACVDCLAWFPSATAARCRSCRKWRRQKSRAVAMCTRCRRDRLPLSDDGRARCRACTLHVAALDDLTGPDDGCIQLWLGILRQGAAQVKRQPQPPTTTPAPAVRPVSPHLVDPDQGQLFATGRDWSAVAHLHGDDLPGLTPAAQLLVDALSERARIQCWSEMPTHKALRTLTMLARWMGTEAPIPESDIVALVVANPSRFSARRTVQFLEERGHLIPDPDLRRDVHQHAIATMLARLPETFATELTVWVDVERGHGHRRRRRTRSFRSIRRYLDDIMPILETWVAQVTSLREITTDDITSAIATRKGNHARSAHIELRNLFRALRHERVIFRDPTRGLIFPGTITLPDPVPSDRLRGLLDRTNNPLARFAVALVGIHALRGNDLRGLQLNDLDLARGRLLVRRPGRIHTVWLDTLTHHLAGQWLAERHRRWPATTNPHLLINQQTAFHAQHPPITMSVPHKAFAAHGLTMDQVRQDRILNEAHHHADPLHLIRLFGISDETAMRYLTAAHPERTSQLPR